MSPSRRTPNRRWLPCRRPLMMSARSACSPSSARPARARGGTSSSPATTISATRPWWAPRCATPATTATAGPSPCSASAPRHGSWRHVTASSVGRQNCARRTFPSGRQPEVPHPTLDRHPQPGLAHSLPRPPPTARRLDRALQPRQAVRQAQEGHLAPAAPKRLETNPQSLIRTPTITAARNAHGSCAGALA